MVNYYNFKNITVVPQAKEFVDIILSKLQKKTPTVVRKRNPLPTIRKFYTRKVRTAQQFFSEKLDLILQDFPHVERLHPFYNELIRIHYDKDKYCIALSNINKVKHRIEKVGQDIVRRIKYGESLYQCKCQKRAALGQMAKYILKLKETLAYLEEVRQKMARLPCVDPTVRTLILCGFPNVGKSSFMNKITRADVEVQPYAFTTKNLFLGHTQFEYGRYQVIDTPGLLDRDLTERNETEWATITALTCLDACILYIIDISLACGQSLQEQVDLFDSLRPCFKDNPIVIAVNKTDARPISTLSEDERSLLATVSQRSGVHAVLQMSSLQEQGIMEVRNKACSLILDRRIDEQARRAADDEAKMMQLRLRTTVFQPSNPIAGLKRPAHIPTAVLQERESRRLQREAEAAGDIADDNRSDGDDAMETNSSSAKKPRRLERDLELELGDDYVTDLRKHWSLPNEEERYDAIPEIWEGHNVLDYYDPDIEQKLAKLEEEEARLIAAGFYDPLPEDTPEDIRLRKLANKIREVIALRKLENRAKKCNKPRMGRRHADAQNIQTEMTRLGVDLDVSQAPHIGESRSRSLRRQANRRSISPADHARSESRPRPRSESGVRDSTTLEKLQRQMKQQRERKMNRTAQKGEADRHIPDLKPKHLFSGKRGIGKTQRR